MLIEPEFKGTTLSGVVTAHADERRALPAEAPALFAIDPGRLGWEEVDRLAGAWLDADVAVTVPALNGIVLDRPRALRINDDAVAVRLVHRVPLLFVLEVARVRRGVRRRQSKAEPVGRCRRPDEFLAWVGVELPARAPVERFAVEFGAGRE